jgi:hypothetical protein
MKKSMELEAFLKKARAQLKKTEAEKDKLLAQLKVRLIQDQEGWRIEVWGGVGGGPTPAGQTGERWQGGYNAPLPGAPDLLSSCPGQHIAAWRARLDLASNSLHGATLKLPHAGQRGREGWGQVKWSCWRALVPWRQASEAEASSEVAERDEDLEELQVRSLSLSLELASEPIQPQVILTSQSTASTSE